MAQLRTMKRFEEWRKDPENIEAFLELLWEMRFRDACFAIKWPYTLLYPLIHDGGELEARYEAIEKAKAHRFREEAVEIADEVKEERDPIAKAKLRIDVRMQQAATLDRNRYADRVEHKHKHEHTFDLGDRLRRARGRVIEQVGQAAAASLPELVESAAETMPAEKLPAPDREVA